MARDERTEALGADGAANPFDEVDGVQTGRHERGNLIAKTMPAIKYDPDLWKNTTPHLCILSPEDGCWEVDVSARSLTIGRAPDVQLSLPYKSISRQHAVISREEGSYFLQDLSSVSGTYLNGERLTHHKMVMLQHGDSIQLSRVVMQFRRDERHVNNKDGHMYFSRIPLSVQLRVRVIHCSPASVFDMGDTLLVGGRGGGISLPMLTALPTDKVVELEMAYSDGRWIRMLCEVVIVNRIQQVSINCLKLHKLSQREHNDIIRDSRRDAWLPVHDVEPSADS